MHQTRKPPTALSSSLLTSPPSTFMLAGASSVHTLARGSGRQWQAIIARRNRTAMWARRSQCTGRLPGLAGLSWTQSFF
jgi:hypothetical protein